MDETRKDAQAGSTLIVAIVFLLLLSTLALAALRSSTTNVQIVGNMQARQEAQAAAQMMIEQTISTSEFADDPGGVYAKTNTPASPGAIQTDFNGDDKPDASGVLAEEPVCLSYKAVNLADLGPDNPVDAPCFGSASIANPGVLPTAGAPAGSLCADTQWQVTARGSDARSGSSVTLAQGVTVRRAAVGLNTICK
jgi:Tfp pilus assembly protein PilX